MSNKKYAYNLDIDKINFEKLGNGLIPAVVQDVDSKQVLMVGFQNLEAVKVSLEKNKVTFFSRTKNRLWTKGETSNNFLEVIKVEIDCDYDTLLWMVKAPKATCHLGTFSCFGEKEA